MMNTYKYRIIKDGNGKYHVQESFVSWRNNSGIYGFDETELDKAKKHLKECIDKRDEIVRANKIIMIMESE